ncbi:hypothetical protein PanWU01x14_141470 [Parasponia andersonii]|uniref:Uncharacterized protein n=1 Tax=Parasponia andersonii TaxID=3476 RepID=A0A2P5CLR6_PARAD|nr:hypothetical protein PanWU01x14_141470 [Parasponia andersonii]
MGCCFGKSPPPSPPHDRKFVVRPTAPAPTNDHDQEKGPKKSYINNTKPSAGQPGHVVDGDRDQKKQVVHDDDDDDDGDGGDKKNIVDHDHDDDQKKLDDHDQQKLSRGASVISSGEAAKVYKGSVLIIEYGVAPDHQKRHNHY